MTRESKKPLAAIALFEDKKAAGEACKKLLATGIDPAKISYLQRQSEALEALEGPSEITGLIRPEEREFTNSPATSAISGGLLGGSLGWMAGLTLILVPGIGPIIGAGTLATLLGSAAMGATLGGLGGALLSFGVPEDLAHHYAGQLQKGRVLLLVEGDGAGSETRAARLLEKVGGQEVKILGA